MTHLHSIHPPSRSSPLEYGGFLGALGAQYDALFGQFDTDKLYRANRFIGHFFMCAWLTVSVIVLLNLLVGIMAVSGRGWGWCAGGPFNGRRRRGGGGKVESKILRASRSICGRALTPQRTPASTTTRQCAAATTFPRPCYLG